MYRAKKVYDSRYMHICRCIVCIRLSEKFLSFYEEIIDVQCILFYIILSNYVGSILFCWDKRRDISQIWFHVCMKVHCCKKHVCERKILFGQPNIFIHCNTKRNSGNFFIWLYFAVEAQIDWNILYQDI